MSVPSSDSVSKQTKLLHESCYKCQVIVNNPEIMEEDSNELVTEFEEKLAQIYANHQWISENSDSMSQSEMQSIVVDLLLVYAQFVNPVIGWNSIKLQTIADHGIKQCLEMCKCLNIHDLLLGEKNVKSNKCCGLISNLLQKLAQTFDNKNWKKYPGLQSVYIWVLMHLKQPYLVDHLGFLLPPALFLLDDWEEANKIRGIHALNHILQEVACSKLQWYGRAAVIYDALKRNQTSREPTLLKHLYPVLIESACICDGKEITSMGITKLENVFHYLLSEMGFEQRLDRRHVYASVLEEILQKLGILAIRWNELLFEVFDQYLNNPDGINGTDRIKCLHALQIFIQNCRPRMKRYIEKNLEMFISFIYIFKLEDGSTDEEATAKIYEIWRRIVLLLRDIHSQQVSTFLLKYESEVENKNLSQDIAEVVKSIV